jgi:hypothetical protein
MPVDKLRRRSTSDSQSNTQPSGGWKWFEFFGNYLQFNSDTSGVTHRVKTDFSKVLSGTTTVAAYESGTTFFLDSATEFAVTLPAPALGLEYTFIVANAPETASYTVVTSGSEQIMAGHVLTSGFADSGSDVETSAGGTTITFVDSVAVVGDYARVKSDGTNWYVHAVCAVEAGITITG